MSEFEDLEEDIFADDDSGEELYEHYRFVADKGQGPIRIDVFLLDKILNVSRSKIQNAAKSGNVLVNGQEVKPNYKVRPNDLIQVVMDRPPREYAIIAEKLDLDIVYEDNEVLVINKPAGMVVHPGHGNYTGTLVNGLLYLKDSWPQINGESRPGIVHRLDKNTSGILVVGKTESALQHLSRQFYERTTQRYYVALVWGNIDEDSGRIEGHIARHPHDRLRFYVDEDRLTGKWAATNYEVIKRYGYVTLVKCKLETGRTHQIRVHMKYIGHPLFNDYTYGGDKIVYGTIFTKYKQFVENCFKQIPSQALHAQSLSFSHPISGENMHFEAPLPEGFQKIIDKWDTYTQALQMGSVIDED
ncbi:MAG: RluA family pseudouridine synthase [Chitinophagales bacterium]|nr:RluA family pseudouridine synthase [Chitinophagales bacterium]MCZ2393834.1 RluA family pseudouridine synthase [Chitinophagales bacterium]